VEQTENLYALEISDLSHLRDFTSLVLQMLFGASVPASSEV
jgi:hypothetical protein